MLSGRAAGVYARRMAGVRGPVGILLQGALIAFVGLLVTIFNLNNSVPIEKTSGAIQSDYVHSHADTPGNYVYNASWLQISTSIDLFIFNKNDFHPTWNDHVIRGQKVDIYYAGQSPKTILAIQLYDDGGNPSTRYTTTAYGFAYSHCRGLGCCYASSSPSSACPRDYIEFDGTRQEPICFSTPEI